MADERTDRSSLQAGTPVRFVAMGGSAGSMEAFEQFLPQLPPDSGMAFIVISHLEAGRKTLLPEILQRKTRMKVELASDGAQILPDRVYVAPPSRELAIARGRFCVLDIEPTPHRMPIDFFLRRLAADQQARAVAIVFSGMDNDGSEGIKAIKEQMGLVMVQEPLDARFDNMPRFAIATGLADIVAPARDLPAKLLAVAACALDPSQPRLPASPDSESLLHTIFLLLRAHSRVDFALYKRNTVLRRIERRMSIHQMDDLGAYARLLAENRQELDLLFRELLIGVTSFFREKALFEALGKTLIPDLLRDHPPGTPLRVWTPGCSTGEETYSLAIVLHECMDDLPPEQRCPVQIFGTDLHAEAIAQARKGVFSTAIASDVSPERLARFFQLEDGFYRVKKAVRDAIVFAPQNLLADPPFTRLDILCCRNLLIYLSAEVQKRLLPLFHYALNSGGLLVLGISETAGGVDDLFHPVNHKLKVYRRKPLHQPPPIDMPILRSARAITTMPEKRKRTEMNPDLPDVAQRALLETIAPPAVVTTSDGDIVYVNGRTGQFLEPPSGKVNWNIYAMAREGLRDEMEKAIRACAAQRSAVMVSGLRVKADAETLDVDLVVRPLHAAEAVTGLYLIVFYLAGTRTVRPPSDAPQAGTTIGELQAEVQQLRERLQATVEDMETAQEELRSANEELQSNNEELQSTNEELMTSKEELQSLNEEMQTVNAELQSKVDELSQTSTDMRNLLNGTDIATIFLDRDLRVKRFTPQATKIINLIPTDVGRPLAHVVTNLHYERLIEDATAVLEGRGPREMQVQTRDERWYQARILPYRTADNVFDGLVMTFSDITGMKQLETSLREREGESREAKELAESVIATIQEPLVVLDKDLRVVSASPAFLAYFRAARDETLGRSLFDLSQGQWNTPEMRRLLEETLPGQSEPLDITVEASFPGVGVKKLRFRSRRIVGRPDQPMVLLAVRE